MVLFSQQLLTEAFNNTLFAERHIKEAEVSMPSDSESNHNSTDSVKVHV